MDVLPKPRPLLGETCGSEDIYTVAGCFCNHFCKEWISWVTLLGSPMDLDGFHGRTNKLVD